MSLVIADRWFSRKRIDDDITLLWEPHVVPLLRCNIWHIKGRDRDLLIDTGLGVCSLREAAKDLFAKDILAIATHTHYDHIGGFHEFESCAVHRCEAHSLVRPEDATLLSSGFSTDELESMVEAGYVFDRDELILALPHQKFDIASFQIKGAKPKWLLEDGDIIDTGDRHFQVMHLPGHSPGSIGLWEESSGTLFSGDAIYDGPLLDNIPGSNIEDYLNTMEALRKLKVSVVHGGHGQSFGRERFLTLIDSFMTRHGQYA
ncbi:MBL fold metallo-hydrolase [Pseudomaricurvus alkylphenolicus]|uniref:MBL fold metallo-hydrolase n=1 Tax=Pseudomaricurvus alkylphenolicus TaxID=1306991 RepID=UPI001421EB28|nr:MBL fold metallo-hydrolase [Pseudomaricurvus alkylphenolicus]NIB38405.1 MBL fold metallo-hydrolase [Pseudomaricurvus alkylphenolicus]